MVDGTKEREIWKSRRLTVKEGRPAATAVELRSALVERGTTPGTTVNSFLGPFVVFACTGRFCTLFAEYTELTKTYVTSAHEKLI